MHKFFKYPLLVFLFLATSSGIIAQETDMPISEGPYIYWEDGFFYAKWVEEGKMKMENKISPDFPTTRLGLGVDTEQFSNSFISKPGTKQKYKAVSNIVVVSDIHGQYGLMVTFMDRGDKVTEILWLAYKLEQQALKTGGRLHFLIGNHELMVASNDLRYLHPKYVSAVDIMGITVEELYGLNSVLGNWVRQRPAIITINDLLFVHAGISPEFIERKMTAKKVNRMFQETILGPYPPKAKKEEDYYFLMESNGPVWYRGYFDEGEISEAGIDKILTYFKSKHIIVGHTSFQTVSSHFGGKVVGVDSSIKDGEDGEVLVVENGKLFRGLKDGKKVDF